LVEATNLAKHENCDKASAAAIRSEQRKAMGFAPIAFLAEIRAFLH